MITQVMSRNEVTMAGTLTITAEPGYLAELEAVFIELSARGNVVTNGTVTVIAEAEPPTVDE